MMNKIYGLIVFLLSASMVNSQVPNSGFENWTGGYPDEWQTTNIPVVPPSVLRDTDAYAGNYSARGTVVPNANHPFPPYLGYSGPSAQGFLISTAYARIEGFCKLTLHYGDRFFGSASVYNFIGDPIGSGTVSIDISGSGWVPFAINLNYTSTDFQMRCALYFTITDSTGLTSGQIGSTFLVDQLSLAGVSSIGISEVDESESIHVYPNPSIGSIKVHSEKFSEGMFTLINASGKNVLNGKTSDEMEIPVAGLAPGLYYLHIQTQELSGFKKVVVQ